MTPCQDSWNNFMENGMKMDTIWGPLVISWFITPCNYSHWVHNWHLVHMYVVGRTILAMKGWAPHLSGTLPLSLPQSRYFTKLISAQP